ncbi:hypothetical protein GCM10022255_112110 [Dactylosporangium darangshiense]|uniref:Transposase n=1 Tax=Dactylosporangium darangshiense TaxID=579108 RepID=A0ABP8DVH1_9ACTN
MRKNPQWGYRRVHRELLVVGVKVVASSVWEILHKAGIDRAASTWSDLLRSQGQALLACDFFVRCCFERCLARPQQRSGRRRRRGGVR